MLTLFRTQFAVSVHRPKVQSITFLECALYNVSRSRLFQSLNLNINANFLVLISGSPNGDIETNKLIIWSVLGFIKDSHRFD